MKIAIAGFGAEGKSALKYWSKPGNTVVVFDENPDLFIPEGVNSILGADAFSKIEASFDLIIRGPSVSPHKFDDSVHTKMWSSTREFFQKSRTPIIGVTGTKGKGTTASLIYEILRTAGKKVHLAGNIGLPMLDILPEVVNDDVVVLELSSFQLWDLTQSPHVAVVLMIEPDHLNIHEDFDDYIKAKTNIRIHQGPDEVCIYNPDSEYSQYIAQQSDRELNSYEESSWLETMIPYGVKTVTRIQEDDLFPTSTLSSGVYVEDGNFCYKSQIICPVNSLQLVGQHNIENACAAITAVLQYTRDFASIEEGLKNFKGLPHRIEFVTEKKGIKFYDDSYAAAQGATIAAIKSFDEPIVLLCGGYEKGINYDQLASAIVARKNIKKVLLIGQTKEKIATALKKVNFKDFKILETTNFTEIVTSAQDIAAPGDVVLLSPGCASFDMFKNFEDRGNQFKQIVRSL